ncbi:MAG: hypothetical protein ACRCSF_04590 [Mycobacteriaceae bacterium]
MRTTRKSSQPVTTKIGEIHNQQKFFTKTLGSFITIILAMIPLYTSPMSFAATVLTVSNQRMSGTVVSGGVYNYVPSIMFDGVYRMWWCGSSTTDIGDNIFYAESSSPNGPFHARGSTEPYQVVFRPTKTSGTYDKVHTCDPSVIRINGTYYMYYSGWDNVSVPSTKIGLATSADGINWTRSNNGNPIISPANKQTGGSTYGAGQATASYFKGKFYLMYTDTTGANSGNAGAGGAGQYILRSPDPTFQSGVEEFGVSGFTPRTPENHTQYRQNNFISAEMQFSDALNAWVVAHNDGHDLKLSFYSPDFLTQSYSDIPVKSGVNEGPGIISRPDKHSLAPQAGACGTVVIDLVVATAYSTVQSTGPTDLKTFGLDVSAGANCSSMPASHIAGMYEGYAIQVTGLPLTLVTSGVRLQSATALPIQDLTKNFISTTTEVFHKIPFGASLQQKAAAVAVNGQPAAFVLDGSKKWPVSGAKILTDNQSVIKWITLAEYNSYPTGPALYLVI